MQIKYVSGQAFEELGRLLKVLTISMQDGIITPYLIVILQMHLSISHVPFLIDAHHVIALNKYANHVRKILNDSDESTKKTAACFDRATDHFASPKRQQLGQAAKMVGLLSNPGIFLQQEQPVSKRSLFKDLLLFSGAVIERFIESAHLDGINACRFESRHHGRSSSVPRILLVRSWASALARDGTCHRSPGQCRH